MAVFTIAGLILKEAVRRRTFWGALLMGLLVLALSLIPILIKQQMLAAVASGQMDYPRFVYRFPIARSIITTLCLGVIKALGSIFAVLMAGGAVSGEIERGLLSVILAKPIPRWQILLGKWVGLNLVLMGSVFVWATMVWISLSLQTHNPAKETLAAFLSAYSPILVAGLYLTLYPLMVCTLTLTLSTISQRMLGTSLALVIMAVGWFDGIFNLLGQNFNAHQVELMARAMSFIMPQSVIGWWVEHSMAKITAISNSPQAGAIGQSPTYIKDWGLTHLHFAHLDAVYLVAYIVITFALGVVLFERRDI
jgi:ABC-type transport system involved in multi-copper enzyme maturation permease subunit